MSDIMPQMADMFEQVTKMHEAMQIAQEQLENERITVTTGGEAITIVIDGRQRIHSLTISRDALTAAEADPELLQDLLVAALNNAIEQSQTRAAERLGALSNQLNLNFPGM